MSGGSFNYLCYKVTDLQSNTLYSLLYEAKQMEARLRETCKHDAADEIQAYCLSLETAIRRLETQGKYLSDLMHAVEWWQSSDYGPERVDEAMSRLIGKTEGDAK